jgi:hypothetical protein
MHDTSTAGTPTPTNPDLDEQVRDVLSHIFGEAHADGASDKLVASVTKQAASQQRKWSQPKAEDIPAADLRKMLSQRQQLDKPSVMINGVEYVVKLNDVMYPVSNHKQTTLPLVLIDRGANGGVAGSDTRLIDKSLCSVHIQGIDNHMFKDVSIGNVGAVVNTQRGEVIAIMHQYAYTGKGGTIHSSSQLEWCGNDVNDHSIKIDSGRQQLTTPDGYVIPIDFKRGLPYITMRPFTDEEFKEPLIVLSPMTLIGTKLNLHLLYPIQCMMNMGSSVDVFLSTNVNGRFITLMHFTRSQVLVTTNFTTPWSNLLMTQIASSTSSSTMLIVRITFATMTQ